MKNVILAVLIGSFASMSLAVFAEGDAAQPANQMQTLKAKKKELQVEINKIKRKFYKDPEIVELRKKLNDKINEKLSADPDGKQLLNSMEDLNKQMRELKPKKKVKKAKKKKAE